MLRVPTRTQLAQTIYIGDGDGRGKKAMTLRLRLLVERSYTPIARDIVVCAFHFA